jgi:hypothetical protein
MIVPRAALTITTQSIHSSLSFAPIILVGMLKPYACTKHYCLLLNLVICLLSEL